MASNKVKMEPDKRSKNSYLKYQTMLEYIASGRLDAYDITFTSDTKECYIIDPNLKPWSIKSRVYVYDSIESAISKLNQNTDTYAGQIVAIKTNEKYYGYIVNVASGGWSVIPLSEHIGEIDYNTLGNRPIINLYGEIGNPIIVSDQNNGVYIVNGQYKLFPDVSTIFSSSSNHIFVVEKDQDGIYIKKISAKEISEYSCLNGIITESKIITSDFLSKNGYVTTNYVDEKISALDVITQKDLESYISNTVIPNLDESIEQKVDLALDSRLTVADNSDIEALFSN